MKERQTEYGGVKIGQESNIGELAPIDIILVMFFL